MSDIDGQVTAQAFTETSKAARASIEGADRGHFGGAMIHYNQRITVPAQRDTIKDTGRVHVGGGFMRF